MCACLCAVHVWNLPWPEYTTPASECQCHSTINQSEVYYFATPTNWRRAALYMRPGEELCYVMKCLSLIAGCSLRRKKKKKKGGPNSRMCSSCDYRWGWNLFAGREKWRIIMDKCSIMCTVESGASCKYIIYIKAFLKSVSLCRKYKALPFGPFGICTHF